MVVKLPRFPFDKFPTADRSLGSQMKATGEVMAIDRTFGAALNKALRGLEQAGAGFLAEDPTWQSDDGLAGRGLGRADRREGRDAAEVAALLGGPLACATFEAERRAAFEPRLRTLPLALRLAAVADLRRCSAAASRRPTSSRDRHRAVVPGRDRPLVALEAEVRRRASDWPTRRRRR